MPGSRVLVAVPGRELVLQGQHRSSSYRPSFTLEPLAAGQSRLRAQTHAAFPGVAGALYRLAVLRTGAHTVLVRRLLAGVRDRAEGPAEGVAR